MPTVEGRIKETGFAMTAKHIRSLGSHCMPNNAAFEGKLVQVIERNEHGDCLCVMDDKPYMANIDASDITGFFPMEKDSRNMLVPTGMSLIQTINWNAMIFDCGEIYNAAIIMWATNNEKCPTYEDYKEVYKYVMNPTTEVTAMFHFMKVHGKGFAKQWKDAM